MTSFQDQRLHGVTIDKGQRDCATRYALIKAALPPWTRPFTMLDLGAAQGYFGLRFAEDHPYCCAVMIDEGPDLQRMLAANELVFEGLFCATPHVFVCADHPLAGRSSVTLEDLEDYPFLSYEQGSYNSFYYSEELTSTFERRKNIRVRDRATLFNLAMGLNGYTVCSGVISHELNGPGIISIPLDVDEYMEIGIITRKNTTLTRYGRAYIDAIRQHI